MEKKLTLKKQTIAKLNSEKLEEIKAGVSVYTCPTADNCVAARFFMPCWENFWTMYKCYVIYTCTNPYYH